MPLPANQTASFLRNRFREVGLKPVTKHGQNFLIDGNLQRLIIDSAELDAADVVLEVGTGTGALTAMMAERAAAVVSFEIDDRLHQLSREELFGVENVTLLRQDVLKNKNHFHPNVMAAVRQRLEETAPGRRLKLVANLPYNIATPVVSNLLLTEIVPVSMTVTIQKELADRITARPSTKDYGSLSVWMQSQCRTELVRVMAPSVFWPRPKVTSAIIRVTLDEQLRSRIPDLAVFHQFVRSLFLHRRKFLRGVLRAALKNELTKEDVDGVMAEMGLGATSRAEELDVATILALCDAVQECRERSARE